MQAASAFGSFQQWDHLLPDDTLGQQQQAGQVAQVVTPTPSSSSGVDSSKRKEGPAEVSSTPKKPKEEMDEFRKMHEAMLKQMMEMQQMQAKALVDTLAAFANQHAMAQVHAVPPGLPTGQPLSTQHLPVQTPSAQNATSSATPAPGAGTLTVADPSAIEATKEQPVSPEIMKHLRRVGKKYEDTVRKWTKAKDRTVADARDMEILNGAGYRYPPGMRPFRSPVEATGLDDPWGDTANAAQTFRVDLPMGCTRRQAMQFVHHAAAKFMKARTMEANAAYVTSLNGKIGKNHFLAAVNQWEPSDTPSLGLEDGLVPKLDSVAITREALKIYTDIVERIRKESADADQSKKAKQEADAKAMEELAKHNPQNLIRSIVEKSVEAKLAKNEMEVDQEAGGERNSPTPVAGEEVDLFCSAIRNSSAHDKQPLAPTRLPKNGVSPAGAGASSSSNTNGTKGKGKKSSKDHQPTKAKGKSTSKTGGKGKPNTKTGGKGKSSGKVDDWNRTAKTSKGHDISKSKSKSKGKGKGPQYEGKGPREPQPGGQQNRFQWWKSPTRNSTKGGKRKW